MTKLQHITQRPICWIRIRIQLSKSNIRISLNSPLSPSKGKKHLWRPNFDIKMSLWARTILGLLCYWIIHAIYHSLMHPSVLPNPCMVLEGWHMTSYSNFCFSMFPHLPTDSFLRCVNIIYPTSAWVLLMQPDERWKKLFTCLIL